MYKIKERDGDARIATLKTSHGVVESPFFMPVATKAAPKQLSSADLEGVGSCALITNSFLLSLRPGLELIQQHGGLHGFMGWDNCIFTDSGGFQFLQQHFFRRSTAKEAFMRSPFDGKTYSRTPEETVHIQEQLGSDVMMCLDEMPLYGQEKERVAAATRRTHSWARRCLDSRRTDQLLFGIVQGGIYPDL